MARVCPFCHETVERSEYQAHLERHTRPLDDGQMTDHQTLRPDRRFQGDISHEPQWYRHEKCGGTTGMPDYIVRTYLRDPYFYNAYTFCGGCGGYVHESECVWEETGERLDAYKRRLQRGQPFTSKLLYFLLVGQGLRWFGAATGAGWGLAAGWGWLAAALAAVGWIIGNRYGRSWRQRLLQELDPV